MWAIGECQPIAAKAGPNSGFTLLEILVVLMITAGLAMLISPLSQRSVDSAKLQAGARTLVSDIRMLRQKAIAEQRDLSLSFDVSSRSYFLGADGRKRQLPDNLSLEIFATDAASQAAPGIQFSSDGTSNGGHIVLTHGERHRTITVMRPFGQVVLHE